MFMDRFLIVNADDFGASAGINRGIVECHVHGVVTSTSLMVTGRALDEAVSMSRDYPALAVGLHWDVRGEGERDFDLENVAAVRDEFRRQLDVFHRRLGRMPTHVDSHCHVHRQRHLRPVFRELVGPLGVSLRDEGPVRFIGGFYAQWEWRVTNLEYVRVPFLLRLLREEVAPGWTELSCHPGHHSDDFASVYLAEREEEVRTLTDLRIREAIQDLGIQLVSFGDMPSTATSVP
jgi:chitin disaccharide deacetylase